MKWLTHALMLLEVTPTMFRMGAMWILIALVFYKFQSNRARTALLYLVLLAFTGHSSEEGGWFPRLVAYSVLGTFGALSEAFYMTFFGATWTYMSPRVMGVPLWLFPLWSLCALAMVESYPVLVKLASHGRTLLPEKLPGGKKVRELVMS